VDAAGLFTAAAGEFEGLDVLDTGNRAVVAKLEASGHLLKVTLLQHSCNTLATLV
jgi:isoleucyl-tRNA synthetase